MSVTGASPERLNAACVATPGTLRMSCDPGEKPSSRFWSVTSIGLPARFLGTQPAGSLSRRPVGVAPDLTVHASLGNGSRAWAPPRYWHCLGMRWASAGVAPTARTMSAAAAAQKRGPIA